MSDFDYKKYSLERLEDWICDAFDTADASPQEIYDTIIHVVEEQFKYYKKGFDKTKNLLSLLKGHRSVTLSDEVYEAVKREYNYYEGYGGSTVSSVNDHMPLWGHSDIEALSHQKEDKVVKWRLPVEMDGPSGEYFITFPDDLLKRAGWEEGDTLNWTNNGDGTFTLTKHTEPLEPNKC